MIPEQPRFAPSAHMVAIPASLGGARCSEVAGHEAATKAVVVTSRSVGATNIAAVARRSVGVEEGGVSPAIRHWSYPARAPATQEAGKPRFSSSVASAPANKGGERRCNSPDQTVAAREAESGRQVKEEVMFLEQRFVGLVKEKTEAEAAISEQRFVDVDCNRIIPTGKGTVRILRMSSGIFLFRFDSVEAQQLSPIMEKAEKKVAGLQVDLVEVISDALAKSITTKEPSNSAKRRARKKEKRQGNTPGKPPDSN